MSNEQPPLELKSEQLEFQPPSAEYEGVFTVSETPTDEEGFARPIFKIEGIDENIVFVSPRSGLPKFQDMDVDQQGHATSEKGTFDFVDVTPASLLAKAIEMRPQDSRLSEIFENIQNQDYGDDELLLLDTISAAVGISTSGEKSSVAQTEGFALVLAGLIGNEKAKQILDIKLQEYYQISEGAKQRDESETKEWFETESADRDVEPMPWSEVAFVHSTSHEITRDSEGGVILRPYSHHNEASEKAYPRATLHFTTNASVESHVFGQWSTSNTLIVANGQTTIDRNGNPARMQTIDTYWSVNPGQEFKLGNASLVIPSENLDVLLIENPDEKTIKYLDKPDYTDDERLSIYNLRSKTSNPEWRDLTREDLQNMPDIKKNVDELKGSESKTLQKISLGLAMRQQGIDSPPLTLDAWSTSNGDFDKRYRALAGNAGIQYGIHSESPEHRLESAGSENYRSTHFGNSYNPLGTGRLEAERTVIAGGFISPKVIDRKSKDWWENES